MSSKPTLHPFLYLLLRHSQRQGRGDRGFTLLEMIVIAVIIGSLAAIALPGWLGFLNNRKLSSAQDRAFQVFLDARRQAERTKTTWAASFRINPTNQAAEWSVHPLNTNFNWNTDIRWSSFNEPALQIVTATSGSTGITTLIRPSVNNPIPTGVAATNANQWVVMFNERGCPVARPNDPCAQSALTFPALITFNLRNGGRSRRCIKVTTLLGGIQTERDERCNEL